VGAARYEKETGSMTGGFRGGGGRRLPLITQPRHIHGKQQVIK